MAQRADRQQGEEPSEQDRQGAYIPEVREFDGDLGRAHIGVAGEHTLERGERGGWVRPRWETDGKDASMTSCVRRDDPVELGRCDPDPFIELGVDV